MYLRLYRNIINKQIYYLISDTKVKYINYEILPEIYNRFIDYIFPIICNIDQDLLINIINNKIIKTNLFKKDDLLSNFKDNQFYLSIILRSDAGKKYKLFNFNKQLRENYLQRKMMSIPCECFRLKSNLDIVSFNASIDIHFINCININKNKFYLLVLEKNIESISNLIVNILNTTNDYDQIKLKDNKNYIYNLINELISMILNINLIKQK